MVPLNAITFVKKNIISFAATLFAFLFLTGYFLYRTYILPYQIIETSLKNVARIQSFQAHIALPPLTSSGDIIYHKALTPNKISFSFEDKETGKINASLIIFKNDLYLSLDTPKFKTTLEEMSKSPQFLGVEELQTYQYIKKIIINQNSLHINIPKTETKNTASKDTLTEEDKKMLEKKAKDIFFVRSFDESFLYENQKVKRIVFGVHKDKLISFLNALKDTHLSVKVSDINDAIDVVKSSNNWNSDIVEYLVSKDNYPVKISISVPKISTETLKKNVNNKIDKTNPYLSLIQQQVSNTITSIKLKEQKNTELLTVTFAHLNEALPVSLPSGKDTIELDDITKSINTELIPITSVLSGKPIATPTPLVRKNTYVAPTPVPGSYGSPEWMAEVQRRWKNMGYPAPKNEQEFNFYAPQFCEKNPDLCTR